MSNDATVAIPTNYDLIGFVVGGEHKIMAVCLDDWMGTAVPYKNAAGPICKELCEKRPQDFSDQKAAEMWFLWTHMRNLRNKQNCAGQAYPK